MEVKYATALLRYCNDLTDPNAVNMPVASFLVAKTDDSYFAAAAGFTQSFFKQFFDGSETLSESMLEDIPQLIKRHVNDAFSDQGELPDIRNILMELEGALRNTLNVSEITPEAVETIPGEETGAVSAFLLKEATRFLAEKARLTLEERVRPTARRSGRVLSMFSGRDDRGGAPSSTQESPLEEPMQNFWPIPQPVRQRMRA